MEKKSIGVIFGSRSCEHDVSIISAVQLMASADVNKYDIIPVYIAYNGQWYTGEALKRLSTYTQFEQNSTDLIPVALDLAAQGELITYQAAKGLFASGIKRQVVARIDCACIVMHGMNGEDGTLQGLLEMANIPYTSSGVAGSAIGMDKIMMKQFFKGAGLPVLDSLWYSANDYYSDKQQAANRVESVLGYPVFVKPANLGSSIGVKKVNSASELETAMEVAFSLDRRVLVEKGLDSPIEINCSVMGYDGDCRASVLEMPNTGGDVLDFVMKYMQGTRQSEGMASLARFVPAPIEDSLRDQIQKMSKDIFKMLDCKGVVRIDYMKEPDSQSFYITEINTIPGSLAFYLWEYEGIRFSELIDLMIAYAFKAHEDKNNHNYIFKTEILQELQLGSKTSGTKGGLKTTGSKVK